MKALPVSVETDIAGGLPGFDIVGLPDTSVQNHASRTAMKNSGCALPAGKIIINLAPADLRKEGSGFDLPIAVSILVSLGQLPAEPVAKYLFAGELSLNGELRHTRAILPIALMALQFGYKGIVIPKTNTREALVVPDLEVLAFSNLADLVAAFSGKTFLQPENRDASHSEPPPEPAHTTDMSLVKGQAMARRALEIAAAGNHNILLAGPPGSGRPCWQKLCPPFCRR